MGKPSKQVWHESTLISILIFTWLAFTAWTRPLMLPDEGRYVGVAWEMLHSGNWLTPTIDGLPFFHKPPLFYWITAASMSTFGANEWAARLASMLGAWLGIFSLYIFTRRWTGSSTARMVTITLLVQPLFFIGGQFANLDMLVAGCITATILLFVDAVLRAEQNLQLGWSLVGAYAMSGLGILSKGLIGVVIPYAVIFIWLLIIRRLRRLKVLIWFPGILILIAITAPWFIAMQIQFNSFFHYFFVVQHFQRFIGTGFNNVQPFWFYPAILVIFNFPWAISLYRIFTPRYLTISPKNPVRILMWIWLIVVVLFFSIPKSKLLGYILPAAPPLAYLLTDSFTSFQATSKRTMSLWFSSIGTAAIVSLGAIAWLSINPTRSTSGIANALHTRRTPGELVFMLNNYYYDVPFYGGVFESVAVVDDWKSPDVFTDDSWRKELADAGLFSKNKADKILIGQDKFLSTICQSKVSWVIGPSEIKNNFLLKNMATEVFSQRGTSLWRVDTAQFKISSGYRWRSPCATAVIKPLTP